MTIKITNLNIIDKKITIDYTPDPTPAPPAPTPAPPAPTPAPPAPTPAPPAPTPAPPAPTPAPPAPTPAPPAPTPAPPAPTPAPPAPTPAPPAPTPAPPAPTPVPTPINKTHQGILSKAAYDMADITSTIKNKKGIDSKTFRSLGYFGIGFGGSIGFNGKTSQTYSLADIDLSLYTHINIAFLGIANDGHLTMPNSFASQGTNPTSSIPPWLQSINDKYIADHASDLQMTAVEYVYVVFTELRDQVNRNKTNSTVTPVKLMASIGGWNLSNDKKYGVNMSKVAKNLEKNEMTMRTKFLDNINELLSRNLIDGLDIDWEYPGRSQVTSSCKEGVNPLIQDCKYNEPNQIRPCDSTDSEKCVSFAYDDNRAIGGSCDINEKETYRLPLSKPIPPEKEYKKTLVQYYKEFITTLKDTLNKNSTGLELTIAIAGAPWGLHWYARTIYELVEGNDKIIDFISVMAYDYNGFWTEGTVTGFLSNFTNMSKIKSCNLDNYKANTGCMKELNKIRFNLDDTNTNILNVQDNLGVCPTTNYNELGNIVIPPLPREPDSGDYTSDLDIGDITSMSDKWIDDIDTHTVPEQYPAPHITMSGQAILRLLTENVHIKKANIVMGLPYYGRTFQTSENKPFQEDSYGLYQAYEYGSAYSFSDIHENYYVNNKKKAVFTIPLNNPPSTDTVYTEDIVYVSDKNDILENITPDMTEEMISYNSIDSIKHKVKYLKEKDFGGYMCWHMLSDYYPDATPAQPASNI